jgi:hypothetical protein
VTLMVAAGCGGEPAAAEPTSQAVAAEPTAPKAVEYPEKSLFDFRMAQLDPEVIGTSQRCDVASISVDADDDSRPILVRCAAGPQGSHIAFARTDEVRAALKDKTQIEVMIDAAGEHGSGADARVTLVKVIGELRPPDPPSRCLCDRDREAARDAERPKPPEGWSFALYDKDRDKHWGTKHVCRISSVHEIMRSSPDARDHSVGRVFEPDTLPYAARIYCSSPGGGSSVIVGAHSAHQLLHLEQGQAIEIELGWVKRFHHDPTGKLGRTVYQPDDR